MKRNVSDPSVPSGHLPLGKGREEEVSILVEKLRNLLNQFLPLLKGRWPVGPEGSQGFRFAAPLQGRWPVGPKGSRMVALALLLLLLPVTVQAQQFVRGHSTDLVDAKAQFLNLNCDSVKMFPS